MRIQWPLVCEGSRELRSAGMRWYRDALGSSFTQKLVDFVRQPHETT